MNIAFTLHLWMLVPLCTTAASVLFAWRAWRSQDCWQDAATWGLILWLFTTAPTLLGVWLK